MEEHRRTAASLSKHIEEMERALYKISSEDAAKKEFIAMLAHELRNPLSAILSSVELLGLQGVEASEAPAHLQTIDERVRSMARILEDLLDISRISQHKFTLQRNIIALCDTVDRAVATAQADIHSRGHTLSIQKPPEKIILDADPIRIEQIFVNLLSNASKYSEPGGAIGIVITREGSTAVVRVRDNGIGISQNMLNRIFEPFFQVVRGNRATTGLGIGLSLTKQLVEMHGGTIEAVSEGENKGSEFIVRLPISSRHPVISSADKKTVTGGRALAQSKSSPGILVVDDNEAAADALVRMLAIRGYSTEVAYTGAEAIEKARRIHPRIVILDIGLPDMDGYAVARVLKRDKGAKPYLIALTGFGQDEDKERARKAGFDRHLTKPVGLKEVEAALRKVPRRADNGTA